MQKKLPKPVIRTNFSSIPICKLIFDVSKKFNIISGCPRSVMVKATDCGIVVREFVLQLRYYIDFWANTLGKGMNPLILPAVG